MSVIAITVPKRRPVEAVTLRITTPISKNELHVVARGRIIDSREYRDWKRDAGWEIAAQRPGRVVGRYFLRIQVSRDFGLDLGNAEEATSDVLTALGVIDDDSCAEGIEQGWHDGPGVVITVTSTKALEAA